jgi:ferredoxin-NADP reductase
MPTFNAARCVELQALGVGSISGIPAPVLAMLHALAVEQTRREIWGIHGARNSSEHPFAAEVRKLLETLPGSRSHMLQCASPIFSENATFRSLSILRPSQPRHRE